MVEREKLREREAQQVTADPDWDYMKKQMAELKEKNFRGRKVIRGSQIPWVINRQGILKRYVKEYFDDIVPNRWNLFVHEIRSQSGRHVHQGGLTIFILKGKGYSVVDKVRYDWSEGDLIVLPVKKGGVEHQHFNADDKPSRWFAIIQDGLTEFIGKMYVQKENHPMWKGAPPDV